MTAVLVVGAVLVALRLLLPRVVPLSQAYSRWRIRRAAELRWRAYARRHGLDWRKLTTQQKYEAHLPPDGGRGE